MTYPTQEELEAMALDVRHKVYGDVQQLLDFASRIIDWHTAKLAEQEPVHKWRRTGGDGRWRDSTKEEAYSRVDEHYEARTLYAAPTPPADSTKEALIAARDALERFAAWGRMQHKAQSKGGHATFDLLALRDEVETATEALAKINAALGETK